MIVDGDEGHQPVGGIVQGSQGLGCMKLDRSEITVVFNSVGGRALVAGIFF